LRGIAFRVHKRLQNKATEIILFFLNPNYLHLQGQKRPCRKKNPTKPRLRGIAFRAHNPLQNKATEIILFFLKYQIIYTYKVKKDLAGNKKTLRNQICRVSYC
jgi:hypothetical protein